MTMTAWISRTLTSKHHFIFFIFIYYFFVFLTQKEVKNSLQQFFDWKVSLNSFNSLFQYNFILSITINKKEWFRSISFSAWTLIPLIFSNLKQILFTWDVLSCCCFSHPPTTSSLISKRVKLFITKILFLRISHEINAKEKKNYRRNKWNILNCLTLRLNWKRK